MAYFHFRNETRKDILLHSLLAVAGLFLFAFGVYLTIQANIGTAPWDTLELGLSQTFGILYGTASILVSAVVLIVDILLREPIGIGMLFDAVLVGKFVDLLNWIDPVPKQSHIGLSILVMTVGLFLMGLAQFLYMAAALGCGPRDTMLVGLRRRLQKIPIGLISVFIMATVTLAGWLLGGPIGIGTLLCAFLTGPIMQLDFKLVRFEPTAVRHQNLQESFRVLIGRTRQ